MVAECEMVSTPSELTLRASRKRCRRRQDSGFLLRRPRHHGHNLLAPEHQWFGTDIGGRSENRDVGERETDGFAVPPWDRRGCPPSTDSR